MGRGLQPLALAEAKKELNILFLLIFDNFWCPVVTLVTFSSNLSNFERNPPPKKNNKIIKSQKNFKKSKI